MISLGAVQNNFSHNAPDFYIAPLVQKLCSKDKHNTVLG